MRFLPKDMPQTTAAAAGRVKGLAWCQAGKPAQDGSGKGRNIRGLVGKCDATFARHAKMLRRLSGMSRRCDCLKWRDALGEGTT